MECAEDGLVESISSEKTDSCDAPTDDCDCPADGGRSRLSMLGFVWPEYCDE